MKNESERRSRDLDRRFRALRTADTRELDWGDVTRRAHGRTPRRPLHLRWGFAVALALLVGSGFGFVLGSSNTPSSSAARGGELGFLPARGWNVLQTATRSSGTRPARQAIAANVPLRAEDDADGIPYTTLSTLPRRGVVLVAKFMQGQGEQANGEDFRLRFRDSVPQMQRSAQVRPAKPLGQYRLRADVNGYGVDIDLYFGTLRPTGAAITAAQQQLDRLVVGPRRTSSAEDVQRLPIRAQAEAGAPAASRIIDRTFRCTPVVLGDGLREIDVVAAPLGATEYVSGPSPSPSPGALGVSSGGFSPTSELVSARAAAWDRFRNQRVPEGTYVSRGRCSHTREAVRLSPTGLPGPPVSWWERRSCLIRGRVLVRVRAVLQASAMWQRIDQTYVGARRQVIEAAVAVRSERGRPIAFAELGPAGKTRLWTSSACS
jgi:hypothetical protein